MWTIDITESFGQWICLKSEVKAKKATFDCLFYCARFH